MKEQYTAGIDFGTLSARAVIAGASDGKIYGDAVYEYPHGVITEGLPEGYSLQDPRDYIEALKTVIREAVKKSGVEVSDIKGVGIDFTSCTVLPVDKEMTPLCFKDEFKRNPHAYVKLWKHHSTVSEALEVNSCAEKEGAEWLKYYGGKMTAEMGLPKILETKRKAPEVYDAAYMFVEAGDYISYLLTGNNVRSACFADFKYAHRKSGYPEGGFYEPFCRKLPGDVRYISESAGKVSREGAELSGLKEGTAVALSVIDCHASLPALNVTKAGDLLIVLGTSACHMVLSERLTPIKGICGCTFDTVMPGLATYEAGQTAMGDVFDWYVKNQVPGWCFDEAEKEGKGIHEWLCEKASGMKPGESGLCGIEWLSGNRSVLSDSSRRGLMTGITLKTTPWEIYRAWLEAAAFGTRVIVDNYEENGVFVEHVKATGGIAVKNPLFMQILSDILGKEIAAADVKQSASLGSAIYGAAAAGIYSDVIEASSHMACRKYIVYRPDAENSELYRHLFLRYKKLHDFFGDRKND